MAQVTQAQEAQEVQDNNLQHQLQVVLGKVLEIQEDTQEIHQAVAVELIMQVHQVNLQDKVFNVILHHQQHLQFKHITAVVEREAETGAEALREVKVAERQMQEMMAAEVAATAVAEEEIETVNLDIV